MHRRENFSAVPMLLFKQFAHTMKCSSITGTSTKPPPLIVGDVWCNQKNNNCTENARKRFERGRSPCPLNLVRNHGEQQSECSTISQHRQFFCHCWGVHIVALSLQQPTKEVLRVMPTWLWTSVQWRGPGLRDFLQSALFHWTNDPMSVMRPDFIGPSRQQRLPPTRGGLRT